MGRKLPEYIAVGVVEKAHGITGQLKIRPLTDTPERFELLKEIFVEDKSGTIRRFAITKVLLRQPTIYLRLQGIENREQAQTLKGCYLIIRRADALPLGEEEFYHFEVEGFEVKTEAGEVLGTIAEVWDLAANAVFVVRQQEREYLIPAIKDVVKKIDREEEEIVISPLEGLLD